jgi:4-amino-4-deoxy-L-arabinose transferase-like glycosyltransferase
LATYPTCIEPAINSAQPRLAGPHGYVAAAIQALWLGLIVTSMLIGVWTRPLTEPDEGRNAEIGREMAATGNFTFPTLNGLPYIDKPLIHYVTVACSLRLFGRTEGAARIPSIVATLLSALTVGLFARHLFGAGVGPCAAGVLLLSPLTWVYGQLVILDALFTLWVLFAIVAFYLAVEAAERQQYRRRNAWSAAGWASVALAVLTKGPIGLVLPLLITAPYAISRRASRAVLNLPGAILAIALVTPWVLIMERRIPGYLHYVVAVETWQRVATDTFRRSKPFWYFVPILLLGTFPWSAIVLPKLCRSLCSKRVECDPRWMFLCLWIALPFILFSLSRSKLPHYALPIVPAFAVGLAGLWTQFKTEERPVWRITGLIWIGLGIAAASSIELPAIRALAEPFRADAQFVAGVGCIVMIAAGILSLHSNTRRDVLLWGMTLPILALYFAAQSLLLHLSEENSSRDLVAPTLRAAGHDGRIVGVRAYPLALPFYLDRLIDVATTDGSELTSNYLSWAHDYWLAQDLTLHPLTFWPEVINQCSTPTVLIARTGDPSTQAALVEAGVRIFARSAAYAVYVCGLQARTLDPLEAARHGNHHQAQR